MLVAHRPGVPLAAVRLLVRAGSALDPAGRFGLAHLVTSAVRPQDVKRVAAEYLDPAKRSVVVLDPGSAR